MIAEALALAVSQSQSTGRKLLLECYPIPVGPDQWIPYTLHFDSAHKQISVMMAGTTPECATEPLPVRFVTDTPPRLEITTQPLSLRIEPLGIRRVSISTMPWLHQWTHSLVIALTLGTFAAGLWGWTAGVVAGGATAWHIFTDHWGFTGTALFWPFKRQRHPGLQWLKPRQERMAEFALVWLAVLLIAGNLIRSSRPPDTGPSLLHILLFGGAIPLAILARFRLNRWV